MAHVTAHAITPEETTKESVASRALAPASYGLVMALFAWLAFWVVNDSENAARFLPDMPVGHSFQFFGVTAALVFFFLALGMLQKKFDKRLH